MKRKIMHQLLSWKKDKPRKPLLLVGVRQVGKTFILHEFGQKHFPNFHYVNFEKEPKLSKLFQKDLNPKRILKDLEFHLDCPIDTKNDLVIFDEIQGCPEALTSLKYFHEDLPELHLTGAGSLLGVHLTPVSFPVGKVHILNLRPMSFEEFLIAIDDTKSVKLLHSQEISELAHTHLWTQLKHYFIVGGMPEAVSTFCDRKETLYSAFEAVREKQELLLTAYYADMAKHSGKINAMHLDRLFKSLPGQLEKEQNSSAAKFKFKGVVPGVSHYQRLAGAIDWLTAAGLAIKVNIVNSGRLPFKGHTKENAFKLLLFDIGMLGAMSGLTARTIMDYNYGSYKGYFAENFVAQELLCSGEKELFCWQEKKAEVEFLVEEEGLPLPVEVKAGYNTKAKSLTYFAEKYHPKRQLILSTKPPEKRNHTFYYPLYLAGYFKNVSSD